MTRRVATWEHLDLSFNDFVAHKTQKFLTSLHKLEYLNLSFAGHGQISNQLSNLSSLRYLDLSGWSLWEPSLSTEKLQSLSTFSNLKYLDLSYTSLINPKEWLSSINMLSSLECLLLTGCDLEDASASLLVNFTTLRFLDLSENFINSSIPPWFQNFSKLEHLDLSDNDLQGKFPTSILENNQGLRFLGVSSNRMEGQLLKNSSIFCNLQVLMLSSNKFSGRIFDTKDGALNCRRSNLKIVDIYNNNFSGYLPNQFENFKDLEFLDLSQNSISGPIPDTVGQLLSLTMLNLSFNKLSGNIPKSVGQISNLKVMDISNNQLDGIVDQLHFANLTNLIMLNIYSNRLVINVSASWVPPFQIRYILMSSCKVGPEFPNWLRTQKEVSILDMSNASISDEVPHWLSNVLSSIERLDLSNNLLRGDISRIIGKEMPILTQMSLSGNNLSGKIPNSLCMSNQLSFLDLSKNQLFGRLPGCWRKSQAFLEWISLGDNKLNGQIPKSLCHLEQLKVLGLHENGLDGVLPKCLLKLDLRILDLSDNQFTGRIPLFGNPRSFEIIDLGRNYFIGDIPLQLCHLANLQYLSLYHNNLSGGIPRCFNNFSRMWANSTLYFRSAGGFPIMVDIRGISIEFTSTLPYLFSIDLSSNGLDGKIPEGLTCLARLQNLNLSQNKLVGKIPLDIGNLKYLESLDLSDNKLSNEIPHSISNLYFLSHLDLSNNNLSGPIPSGNQLNTLDDQSIYRGNDGLCGPPLLKVCPRDELDDRGKQDYQNSSKDESNEGDSIIIRFYSGLGSGFAVTFMGYCGILHFKKSWRISYFLVVDRVIRKLSI
ncbi:hypothetical protein EUGRSUZ_I00366, partial [Eucalyptus grandis]